MNGSELARELRRESKSGATGNVYLSSVERFYAMTLGAKLALKYAAENPSRLNEFGDSVCDGKDLETLADEIGKEKY